MVSNFDPIIQSSDEPIPVETGSILVARGRRGAVAFADGAGPTFGERMFGGYKQYHLIRTSDQTLEESFEVQSSQISYRFKVSIRYRVTVSDPAAVVTRGIRDLRELVGADLRQAAAVAARGRPITQSPEALGDVQRAVTACAGAIDPAVRVRIIDVILEPDTAARQMLATLDKEKLDIDSRQSQARVNAAQRGIEGVITASPNELLSQWLATGDERYRDVLDTRMRQEASNYERLLAFAKMLQEAGQLEAFDFEKKFPDLGPKILDAIGGMLWQTGGAGASPEAQSLPNSDKAADDGGVKS